MYPDALPDDVVAELNDPEFETRQHYSRATYADGCHGPLCRLAETHRMRRKTQVRAEAKGREYRPSISSRLGIEEEERLIDITVWYLESREKKLRTGHATDLILAWKIRNGSSVAVS